jgi:hypothetical protein
MKRIITFFLIILVLVFVALIIINKLERNKVKEDFYFQESEAEPEEGEGGTTPATDVIVQLNENEDLVHGVNIFTIRDKFYTIPKMARNTPDSASPSCDNTDTCNSHTDCDNGQECHELIEGDGSKCYDVLDKVAYELESERRSYITIKNNKETNIFSFSLGFILKNSFSDKYIITSESGSWALKNINNNLFLIVFGNSETDEIKINNAEIICYKYYTLKLNITDSVVKINFNGQPNNSEIYLKQTPCVTDNDCINGECTGSSNNRVCKINSDTYYVGKYEDNFYDMFVGDIKINYDESNESESCGFYGKSYKNKRICLEECKNMNCTNAICEEECRDVTKCAFEATGRHSINCLQECIKNDDCDSAHCRKECEECGSNCPWNKNDFDVDDFDSQYFDKEGKPSPLKLILNTISTDGTKVSVTWREPFRGKLFIKGYISYLYKTFNKSEGVKVNKIAPDNCIGNVNKKKCEFILHDLIPNETYTLGIKSYNGIGMSIMSNLVTFKASVTNINMDLRIEEEVDDYDVGDYNYCNIDK